MTQIERFLLDDQPPPVSHYCHVVKAGNRIWLSGTVGMRPDGSAPDDVVAQFRIAMSNLDGALTAAGGRPELSQTSLRPPRVSPSSPRASGGAPATSAATSGWRGGGGTVLGGLGAEYYTKS